MASRMRPAEPATNKRSSEVFVVVPSFNHAPFIERCLRSIIAQTLKPKKLLVIDDGSGDDSPQIIENVLKDCDFDSELIVRENRGLCRTLNQALALSSAKYFAYIGSDDFWLPGFLSARQRFLDERQEAVLAYGHAYLVGETGGTFDSTENYSNTWANYPDGDPRSMLLKGRAPISSTVMYRRMALENTSWNEDARLEDYEMYLRLMNSGDFAFDPSVLSAWRRHSRNTSGDRMMMLTEVLAAQERNFDALGIDRRQLDKIQMQTRFLYARIELQHGNKGGAMKLASESWRGAASASELVRFVARMLIPMGVVERRRSSRRRRDPEPIAN